MTGIFNPNASVLSDLSLIVNWVLFIGVITAWYLAYQRKIRPHHKVIWSLLILNFLTIIYMDFQLLSILPDLLNQLEPNSYLPLLHGMAGTLVFLLALYTTFLMSFPKKFPERFKVNNTSLLMRITAILWMTLVLSGTFLYLTWYPL